MRTNSTNPRVSNLLITVTALEVLVLLVAGGGLFFLPDSLSEIWPWELAPFNTALLGAIYLSSMISAAALVYIGRWSPARVVIPLILIFTAIVLVVSLIYLDRFELGSPSTWLWFLLYVGIPLNAAYHQWLYRDLPPARKEHLGTFMRGLLMIGGVLYGIYGLGLLVAPQAFGAFWPWALDGFHARLYSVAFLTPALGALLLIRSATWAEARSLGLTLVAGGLLPLLGLVMVGARTGRVDWTAAGTWMWLGLFGGFLILGIGILWAGNRLTRPAGQLNEAGFRVSIRLVALLIGLAFTAAGIAGFMPVFTTPPPAGAPPLVVETSHVHLLGLFPVNLVHNLFHLSIGLLGLALGFREGTARLYVQGFAVILAILTLAGFVPGLNNLFGLAPIYGHDVWLHGLEALAAGYVGFVMPTDQGGGETDSMAA